MPPSPRAGAESAAKEMATVGALRANGWSGAPGAANAFQYPTRRTVKMGGSKSRWRAFSRNHHPRKSHSRVWGWGWRLRRAI